MTDRARKRRAAWRKTNKLNVTFNTHKALKALKSSGFDEKQAEAVVETIDKAVNETVATKADLALLTKTVEGIQENMATKTELKNMADKMATKTELKNMADKMATKDDLEKMVTKEELRAEISSLEARIMRMMLLQTMVLVGMLITMIVSN